MASCYRPDSPIFSQGRNRVRDICLSEGKIHRIVPKLEAVCRLAHIDSTHCIWFKMADHICPKLQLAVPSSALRPLENPPAKYDYVMAPLEEGIYARARVLFVQQLSGDRDLLAFVHFIDEGVGAWLLASCLAQMESQLYCYPWQTFPVALFKIELDNEEYSLMFREENWLEQVKGQLLTIMSQFELFKVVPVPNKTRNNYCEYSRAEIYGLKAPEDNKPEAVVATEESIGHQLAMDMPFELLNRNMFDVQHQPLPAIEDMQPLSTEEEVLAMLKEMPKWRQHFPSNLNHSNLASSKDNNILDQLKRENSLWEWDEELGPVWVRAVTAEWLKVKCSLDGGSILLHLDIYSLKSPFEFYGFPLRTVQGGGGGGDHVDSIKRLYDQQVKLSETLTTFYGNPENSKPIEVDKVAQQLTSQAPFYAIYHQIGDEAQGPAFRRVQLLSLRNMEAQNWKAEFGRIRYLDFGGTELVPISSLIRIHSSHCKQRPLCIQLCLDGICPSSSASTWHLDELKCFRSLFPVNLPAQSELRLIVPDNAVVNFDTPAHRWPGVFGAYNLCIDGQKMEETMVAKGKADWALSNGVVNGTTQQIAGLQMQITDN